MRRIVGIGAVWLTCSLSTVAARAQEPEPGIRLDFQDVELGLVLSALADAGGLNLIYTDLPNRRVTLRMNQPVSRDQILPLIRSLAASNDLTVVDDGALLRIESSGRGGATTTPGVDAAAGPPTDLRLYVHRLKHAQAPRLAATLQAMFGGSGFPMSGGMTHLPLSQQLDEQRIPAVGDAPISVDLGEQSDMGLPGRVTGDVLIVPDEPTNSLLVRAQPADWEVLRGAIETLDLRPLQVMIEVVIAEVRRSEDFRFGLTGQVTSANRDSTTAIGGKLTGFTGGDVALEVMRLGGTTVRAALSALATNGTVRVLSRPVVLAQNNQEARILIGAERPFIQVFRSLPTDAAVRDQVVQYRDVGTSLTIVPTINDEGYVNLQVVQEVSTATAEEQFGAPIISTREASTQLFVRDGQTVVIGGLIDQQVEKTRSGIPLLKDLPILGFIFGSTQETTSQSELFLFLTPRIIETDEDADDIRDALENDAPLLRDLRRPARDSVPGGR